MHLGDLGDQIVLKSRKAFKQIEFLGAEKVLRNPWLNRKKDRDDKARKAYFSTDRMSYVPGGIYVNRIIEEEIKRDDPRLR